MGARYGKIFSEVTNLVNESAYSTVSSLIPKLSYGTGVLYHSLLEMTAEDQFGQSIMQIIAENKLSAALSLTCLILMGMLCFYHLKLTQLTAKLQDKSSLAEDCAQESVLLNAITLADLEKKDEHGRTPLLLAVYGGNSEKVKKLLAAGADYNARDDFKGSSLSYATQLGQTGIVQLLFQYKVDMEVVDEFGNTPLLLAASNGHKKIVEILLEKGANLMATNKAKLTAADLAQQSGYGNITDLLREKAGAL